MEIKVGQMNIKVMSSRASHFVLVCSVYVRKKRCLEYVCKICNKPQTFSKGTYFYYYKDTFYVVTLSRCWINSAKIKLD